LLQKSRFTTQFLTKKQNAHLTSYISSSLLQRMIASIVVVFIFSSTGAFQLSAQTPTTVSAADSAYFRRLEYIAKVWGYVKS
jgi:hypothetical protein